VWVLKDVSFDLFFGETLGIIGRNGAGKSSILRLLAGIIKSNRGQFINHGCSTALLSLQAGFIPYLTGRENAVLSGLLLGLTRREVDERMPAIIEFSELVDVIDRPLNTYSTGMRARLGFSVAYQVSPDVLLIDEVLGVGDEEFKIKSTQAMRQRIRENKTVVLVSHNAGLVKEVCQRGVWIDDGTVRAIGNAADIVNAYQNDIRTRSRAENTSLRRS
jgi:lipopolysaccharide transport system ATP-binding protein